MIQPNILVIGGSGTGKSTSLENLDPEKTIILNLERKQLPFKGASRFKRMKMIDKYRLPGEDNKEWLDTPAKDRPKRTDFLYWLKKSIESSAEIIIIESYTTLFEMIYDYCRTHYDGFAVWDAYATEIYRSIQMTKGTEKLIIGLAIDMIYQDEENRIYRTVKIDGNKMKGAIEKEFVIVLFTQVNKNKNKMSYHFLTNNNGQNTAKSPKDMFNDLLIPNDLEFVRHKIQEYYKED